MNRLTKKIGIDIETNKDVYNHNNSSEIDVLTKLGHTEDIEEKHNMSIYKMDAYITEHKKIEQRCEIIDTKIEKYEEGETVLYRNGSRFELGIVKRVCGGDEYFVNYHTGDTAARTHARHLHKVANAYAFHVIRLDPDDNERR